MNDADEAKPLFLDNGRLSQEGLDLNSRINEQLAPWFVVNKYPQEVAAIIHAAAEELRCETILEQDSPCPHQRGPGDKPSQGTCVHPSKMNNHCDYVGRETECPGNGQKRGE